MVTVPAFLIVILPEASTVAIEVLPLLYETVPSVVSVKRLDGV